MDFKKPKLVYWFFIIAGFVITLTVIHLARTKTVTEKFATSSTTTTTTSTTQNVATNSGSTVVAEDELVKDLPKKSKLSLYLSSFSEPATYQCETNYWCDAINPRTKFFMLSDRNMPLTLTPSIGLPLPGVLLKGPPAYSLSPAPYTLGSFTLAFYAKINSLTALDEDGKIILWDVPAESPHRVQLFIRPSLSGDPTKAVISVTFGSECTLSTTTMAWEFDRSTLINTVNTPTLFALVFDKENKKMQFYAGVNTTPENPKEIVFTEPPVDITLGMSEITINKNKNWDANLVAFTYYSTVLTGDDLRIVDKYLMQHSSGYTTVVRAKETLESEVQELMKKLTTGEDTIKQLLDKLNASSEKCASDATAETLAKIRHWQIKMDGKSVISEEDIKKCSVLNVNAFGAKKETSQTETSQQSPSSSSARYKIPYPPNVSSQTAAKDIQVSAINNPTKPAQAVTTQTTTTSVSSVPLPQQTSVPSQASQDTEGFWKNFFAFMQDQKAKTDATTSKVNLNTAYDQLRNEVNLTDKTRPGNAVFQASVQDPTKTVDEVVTEEEPSGFWASLKDIFT